MTLEPERLLAVPAPPLPATVLELAVPTALSPPPPPPVKFGPAFVPAEPFWPPVPVPAAEFQLPPPPDEPLPPATENVPPPPPPVAVATLKMLLDPCVPATLPPLPPAPPPPTVTASPAVVEAVNEVAAVLGVAIADLSDDLKTRAVARWQAWLAAEAAATNQFDLKAGTASVTRSQFFEHIQSRLARSEAAASRYSEVADALAGAGGTAYVTSVSTGGSPYGWPSEWE